MESPTSKKEEIIVRKRAEVFEVGPCETGTQMGFLIGQKFSSLIRGRIATDNVIQNQIRPFVQTPQGQQLLQSLSENNQKRYPRYWDELVGTAQGSGVPLLDILLLTFRKEIIPFVPKKGEDLLKEVEIMYGGHDNYGDDCSDILVVGDSMAIAAHNEDATTPALIGHTFLLKATLPNGLHFTAYAYAGELPTCSFGFNSHGLGFTLNSVSPVKSEVEAGGIGRNFIARDLLEATSIDDALKRIRSAEVSVGHNYNLVDMKTRRIVNVESASRGRISIYEVGETPLFHANLYLRLNVLQVDILNSLSRHKRADLLPKGSKSDLISLLGETPIYGTGPLLHTMCTVLFDLDAKTVSITEDHPKNTEASHVFQMP